jgi:hypothetical protein
MGAAFKTRMIQGTKPTAETLTLLQKEYELPTGASINLMVFEIEARQGKYYCCWSGGEITDGEAKMTLVGQAAAEALVNLPLGDTQGLIVQELRLGSTPLREKVEETLRMHPPGAKICFLGDMAKELDGKLHEAFNVVDGVVHVGH